MPSITRLAVTQVRCHKAYELDLSPTVTVITGANGSGKTSLLEALYIAARGKSFRGSDDELLKKTADWWKVQTDDSSGIRRSVAYSPAQPNRKKRFIVDSKTFYRLPPAQKQPVVLFEPDDLRLLQGSPARRRQFIDRLIMQIIPQYQTVVSKYERALRQRNNLLKNEMVSQDELFAWNVSLSQYGAEIITQRTLFIEKINQLITPSYQQIAPDDERSVALHYSDTLVGDVAQKLLNQLTGHDQRDRLLGYTSSGPHRHDVSIYFDESLAAETASRGEIRTIILALKFIEARLISDIAQTPPLILLDDVYSELDTTRQTALASGFSDYQVVMTSATSDSRLGKIINLS